MSLLSRYCVKLINSPLELQSLTRSMFMNEAYKIRQPLKGNSSFVLNIFRGNIACRRLFPFPEVLTPEQKKSLQEILGPLEKFLRESNDPSKNDAQGRMDESVLKRLWEMGVFGAAAPKDKGGLGFNNTQLTRLLQTLGGHDLSLGFLVRSHISFGLHAIMAFGTEEQKAKYLPRMAKGQYAAYCLTEKTARSDYNNLKTRAELSADKTHYVLNGSKVLVTNGDVSEVMTVFAQVPTSEKDPESGDPVDKMSAFIVERDFGGIKSGPPYSKMGLKAVATTEVHFEGVKVPVENVLGEVGAGMEMALHIICNANPGIAAILSGAMRACINNATEYSRASVQFRRSISSFELIQGKLAEMAMLQYVTESMAYVAAANMDYGSSHFHSEAAISKCFASEAAFAVCDECIQIMGSSGYMTINGVERILRDVRAFRIVEISNDILRIALVLSGARYMGVKLENLDDLGQLINISTKRGRPSSSTLEQQVHKDLLESAKLASTCVYEFSNMVDRVLRKYSSSISRRQLVLCKLADCAMDIYSMVVVLSRATSAIERQLSSADYEKLIANCWCIAAADRIKNNLKSIKYKTRLDNLKRYVMISEMLGDSKGVAQLSPLNL